MILDFRKCLNLLKAWKFNVHVFTNTTNKEIQKIMKSDQKFDVLLSMFSDSYYIADHFDCPIIVFCPNGPFPFLIHGSGNVINLSVQPLITGRFIEPMNFAERLGNHILSG